MTRLYDYIILKSYDSKKAHNIVTIMERRIAILHPDLGIGGAEQLIINVALSLMSRGYKVTIFTPFSILTAVSRRPNSAM